MRLSSYVQIPVPWMDLHFSLSFFEQCSGSHLIEEKLSKDHEVVVIRADSRSLDGFARHARGCFALGGSARRAKDGAIVLTASLHSALCLAIHSTWWVGT